MEYFIKYTFSDKTSPYYHVEINTNCYSLPFDSDGEAAEDMGKSAGLKMRELIDNGISYKSTNSGNIITIDCKDYVETWEVVTLNGIKPENEFLMDIAESAIKRELKLELI